MIQRITTVGTRSLLFGAHCFFIHPWFVLAAWWKLYGFPWDPRIWVAALVHDWGYWGCRDLDGPEGKAHVELGGRIMHALFDGWEDAGSVRFGSAALFPGSIVPSYHATPGDGRRVRSVSTTDWSIEFFLERRSTRWLDFCRYHSRSIDKAEGARPSPLCAADKLAVAMEPAWLYLPRVWASGEFKEYLENAGMSGRSLREWHAWLMPRLRAWAEENR